MSISLGANGGSYSYPQENDPAGWGDDATNWASAVSAALGNIGLGGTVSATSLIDMSGTTTKGFLPPKLTTVQRNAIATPPAGLVIYNTTTSQLEVYTGSSWFSVASNIDGNLTVNGNSTLNGTLTVTGTTSLASVTGTGLTVNGSTTLNGALTVTGSTSLQSVTSTGETVNGVLSVTGNTTLVNVTGANITSTGTILAASGTSGSPGISFSGDTDTGLYRIGANTIGIATNGTRVGEIGVGYGGFTGNVIQVVSSTNTYYQSISGNALTDLKNGATTNWETTITPRYSNSRIIVIYSINTNSNNPSVDLYFGFRINRQIGTGSYSIVYQGTEDSNGGYNYGLSVGSTTSQSMYTQITLIYEDNPSSSSQLTYKPSIKNYYGGQTTNFNIPNINGTGKSYLFLIEVQA